MVKIHRDSLYAFVLLFFLLAYSQIKIHRRATALLNQRMFHFFRFSRCHLTIVMGSPEKNFQWDNHECDIIDSFKELKEKNQLLDATIHCSDSLGIKAHKVILCTSSLVFKEMLSTTSDIYLRGISGQDVKPILHYIYYGEVNVLEEDLESFLKAGRELQIQGLIFEDNEEEEPALELAEGEEMVGKGKPSFSLI